jgi:phosphoglycolate phosphatase
MRTVLWDWNGTLLDDVDLCVDALNHLLAQYDYPQRYDTERYRQIFGFPIRDYYSRAGFDFARDHFEALAASYMEFYLPAARTCGLMPGARTVLAELQRAGVRQIILSASDTATLEDQVTQRGIRPYFSELLGLTDIYAKSKVQIGLAYLAQGGIDPDKTVMVGDSVHDSEVAAALGVHCLLYCGGHQPRGILEDTGAPVFDSLEEICRAILREDRT